MQNIVYGPDHLEDYRKAKSIDFKGHEIATLYNSQHPLFSCYFRRPPKQFVPFLCDPNIVFSEDGKEPPRSTLKDFVDETTLFHEKVEGTAGLPITMPMPPLLVHGNISYHGEGKLWKMAFQPDSVFEAVDELQSLLQETYTREDGDVESSDKEKRKSENELPSFEELIFEPKIETIGLPCVASFEDGMFYRAEILNFDIERKEAEVRFVDFGNTETVPLAELKPLLQCFNTVPPFALLIKDSISALNQYLPEMCGYSQKECEPVVVKVLEEEFEWRVRLAIYTMQTAPYLVGISGLPSFPKAKTRFANNVTSQANNLFEAVVEVYTERCFDFPSIEKTEKDLDIQINTLRNQLIVIQDPEDNLDFDENFQDSDEEFGRYIRRYRQAETNSVPIDFWVSCVMSANEIWVVRRLELNNRLRLEEKMGRQYSDDDMPINPAELRGPRYNKLRKNPQHPNKGGTAVVIRDDLCDNRWVRAQIEELCPGQYFTVRVIDHGWVKRFNWIPENLHRLKQAISFHGMNWLAFAVPMKLKYVVETEVELRPYTVPLKQALRTVMPRGSIFCIQIEDEKSSPPYRFQRACRIDGKNHQLLGFGHVFRMQTEFDYSLCLLEDFKKEYNKTGANWTYEERVFCPKHLKKEMKKRENYWKWEEAERVLYMNTPQMEFDPPNPPDIVEVQVTAVEGYDEIYIQTKPMCDTVDQLNAKMNAHFGHYIKCQQLENHKMLFGVESLSRWPRREIIFRSDNHSGYFFRTKGIEVIPGLTCEDWKVRLQMIDYGTKSDLFFGNEDWLLDVEKEEFKLLPAQCLRCIPKRLPPSCEHELGPTEQQKAAYKELLVKLLPRNILMHAIIEKPIDVEKMPYRVTLFDPKTGDELTKKWYTAALAL